MSNENRFNLTAKIATKGLNKEAHTFTAVASSTSRDRSGDAFALSALHQMAKEMPGRTVFVNHQYSVPLDVIGRIEAAAVRPKSGTPHSEMIVTIRLDEGSAKAMEVERQIASGLALGLSVGVIVLASEIGMVDGKKTLIITETESLEISVVANAANRDAENINKAWRQAAYKAASFVLTPKGVDLDRPPAVTDMAAVWQFVAAVKGVEVATLRAENNEIMKAQRELMGAVNAMLDQPLPRKIVDANQFSAMAEKYPWLDSRIAGQLAREAHSNA